MRLQLALFAGLLALPSAAPAFCGFFVSGADAKLYNDASQVVLMRKGNRTVMSMSNNYKGPTEDFAMVVPVPVVLQEEQVKTLPTDVFHKVDQLSAPRLVEYWEKDPCSDPVSGRKLVTISAERIEIASNAPRIEAQFEVGEYDVVSPISFRPKAPKSTVHAIKIRRSMIGKIGIQSMLQCEI